MWKKFSVIPGSKFAIIWELLIIAVILIVSWVYSYQVINNNNSILEHFINSNYSFLHNNLLQAGFSRYKTSSSYGINAIGQSFFGLTYLLDLILVADIIVSMRKAIVTPTGM